MVGRGKTRDFTRLISLDDNIELGGFFFGGTLFYIFLIMVISSLMVIIIMVISTVSASRGIIQCFIRVCFTVCLRFLNPGGGA